VIAIGDVSGHGLDAGLVRLMAQTAVSTAIHSRPDASPREIIQRVNDTLYENVRQRLKGTKHMTLTILRTYTNGKIVMAGAHMDLIVLKSGSSQCEELRTDGGARPDVNNNESSR
jgi:serine phosphatase RsbU (regulator of sigma subunit)